MHWFGSVFSRRWRLRYSSCFYQHDNFHALLYILVPHPFMSQQHRVLLAFPFCVRFSCHCFLNACLSLFHKTALVSLPQRAIWKRSGGKKLTWTLPGWSGQKYFLICRSSGSQLSARGQKWLLGYNVTLQKCLLRYNVTLLNCWDLWLTKQHIWPRNVTASCCLWELFWNWVLCVGKDLWKNKCHSGRDARACLLCKGCSL